MAEEAGQPKDEVAEVLVMLDRVSGKPLVAPEPTEDLRAKAKEEAAGRKAIFEHNRRGAEARSGRLPKKLLPSLAAGVTNLMLVNILQERVVPQTAKEAADVAKITAGILKDSLGEGRGTAPLTAEERAKKVGDAEKLEKLLEKRAAEANAALGGAALDGEVWDVDDDPVPPTPET
jgi:hypothetical protein